MAVCRDATGEREQRWRQTFQTDLGFLRAFAAFWHGDIETAYEYGGRVLGQASDPQSFLAMATIMYYGASLALTGRSAEYLRFIEGGTTGPGFSESPQQLPYRVAEAVVHLYRGELAQCRTAATRLTTSAHFPIPKYFEAIGYFLLGVVAYERNRLDEAERHFLAVDLRRFDAAGFIYHGAAVGLAQIAMARGDIGAAERHAAAARAFALQSQSAMLVRASDAIEDHLAVAAGRPTEAAAAPPSDPDFMHLPITAPSYSWAWVQIHSASLETRHAALDFVDAALQLAETHGVTRRVIQLSALRALALDAQNRRDEAVSALDAALRRGAAQGFVRSFADCGEALRPLLDGVLAQRPDDADALRVLGAIGTSLQALHPQIPHPARAVRSTLSLEAEADQGRATPAYGGATPVDSLTNRELVVLDLLHRRLTNNEIAERLRISAATVKMHTLNIYKKLGVHGRRQAVACAVERGILSG
jgi:LuxR family maltose regulon positive regulatory protein